MGYGKWGGIKPKKVEHVGHMRTDKPYRQELWLELRQYSFHPPVVAIGQSYSPVAYLLEEEIDGAIDLLQRARAKIAGWKGDDVPDMYKGLSREEIKIALAMDRAHKRAYG